METTTRTAEGDIAKLEQVLNEYSSSHKAIFKLNPDVDKYLNYSFDELKSLSYEDAAIVRTLLGQYANYLRKEQNRQNVKVRWIDAMINRTIVQKLEGYRVNFQTFEERKSLAILDNSYTTKLQDLKIQAESRLSEIYGLADQVNSLAEIMRDITISKRRYNDT